MNLLFILLFLLFNFVGQGFSFAMELSIDDAVDYAMKNNLDLKAKREELNISKGNLTTALTYPFNPEISLEGRSLLSSGENVKTGYRFGEKNEYSLYLSQTFETGGQREIRKDIALKNMDAVQLEIADMERLLTGEVKREFYNLASLEDKLKLSELSVDLSQKLLDVAEKRFRSGDTPKMDVNLARVELKSKESERVKVMGLLFLSKARSSSLLGLSPDTEITVKGDNPLPPYSPLTKGGRGLVPLNKGGLRGLFKGDLPEDMSLKGLKEMAIKSRPDLMALEIKERASDREISLTKAEVSPDVRVSLLYNRDYDKEVYGAGVAIPIPVINKNRGQIETLTAQKIRLNAQRESLKLLIDKEVESAYLRLDSAKRSVELFKNEILPQLRENVDSLKRAYDAGRIGIYTIILEQQKLASNTAAYYDSLFEYNSALSDLEVAAGGSIGGKR
ncbi:MAG: TolC family protein [Nitrospinae bacterium]|nr:TolC family protein [Nitrospinota bacterium]